MSQLSTWVASQMRSRRVETGVGRRGSINSNAASPPSYSYAIVEFASSPVRMARMVWV